MLTATFLYNSIKKGYLHQILAAEMATETINLRVI